MMNAQRELDFERYPNKPGYKKRSTSRDAARAMQGRASTLRERCLTRLSGIASLTADEIADILGESVLAIRPRITELARQGLIMDSGMRRLNASGKKAIVWKVAA